MKATKKKTAPATEIKIDPAVETRMRIQALNGTLSYCAETIRASIAAANGRISGTMAASKSVEKCQRVIDKALMKLERELDYLEQPE
jgi:hypothetical protein